MGRMGRDLVDLRHRAVGVVHPLNRQQRRGDMTALRADVKGAEVLAEPDVVPLPEGAVHVGMKARQPLAQPAAAEGFAGLRDGGDREVFHDHMRGHHDAGGHRVAAGVQQGDGAAVRMADEHRLADVQVGEQRGEHLPGLAVHVVGLQAPGRSPVAQGGRAKHIRNRVGAPIAAARDHHARASGGCTELVGPVAPHGHRAQAFVQEDQRGAVCGRPCGLDAADFEICAVDVDQFHGRTWYGNPPLPAGWPATLGTCSESSRL